MKRISHLLIIGLFITTGQITQAQDKPKTDPAEKMVLRSNTRDKVVIVRDNTQRTMVQTHRQARIISRSHKNMQSRMMRQQQRRMHIQQQRIQHRRVQQRHSAGPHNQGPR
ncbi:MAG: hypothetical protein JW894_01760 [Bacteroidales bacterium]|nr:hypothetical protein [Bacteroidales bacterium]